VETLLKKYGCEVDLADNGQHAVEKVRVNKYDIILMDVQMTVLGGIEATKIIRREICKKLPIIALIAGVMKEEVERCFTVGMNDYISKPVKPQILKEKILKWIK